MQTKKGQNPKQQTKRPGSKCISGKAARASAGRGPRARGQAGRDGSRAARARGASRSPLPHRVRSPILHQRRIAAPQQLSRHRPRPVRGRASSLSPRGPQDARSSGDEPRRSHFRSGRGRGRGPAAARCHGDETGRAEVGGAGARSCGTPGSDAPAQARPLAQLESENSLTHQKAAIHSAAKNPQGPGTGPPQATPIAELSPAKHQQSMPTPRMTDLTSSLCWRSCSWLYFIADPRAPAFSGDPGQPLLLRTLVPGFPPRNLGFKCSSNGQPRPSCPPATCLHYPTSPAHWNWDFWPLVKSFFGAQAI